MSNYQALHTIDESGARCAVNEGWLIGEFDSVEAAEAALPNFAGGYIRRANDGAILAPDGWIDEDYDASSPVAPDNLPEGLLSNLPHDA